MDWYKNDNNCGHLLKKSAYLFHIEVFIVFWQRICCCFISATCNKHSYYHDIITLYTLHLWSSSELKGICTIFFINFFVNISIKDGILTSNIMNYLHKTEAVKLYYMSKRKNLYPIMYQYKILTSSNFCYSCSPTLKQNTYFCVL